MSEPTLKQIVEALLFASQKPISTKELVAALKGAASSEKDSSAAASAGKASESDLAAAMGDLSSDYSAAGRAFEVRETAAGWQMVTSPAFGPWLRQLYPEARPARLSAPAMETLAIIAYRQPITRADIEAVRGVAVDGVMQTLLDRGLVKIAGRAEAPGRPLLYETTQHFMEHFGLRNLDELPNAGELRRAAMSAVEHPKTAGPDQAAPAPATTEELPLSKSPAKPSETAATASAADSSATTTE